MKKIALILPAMAAWILVATPLHAVARDPEDGAASRPDITVIREAAEARAEAARTTAEERRAEVAAQVEERRAQIKQEVCERRQAALTQALPRLAQGATSVKSSLDTVYGRVVGFYESGELTVANYEELVGSIEAAKANSEAAIATIDGQSFELDCENPNLGGQLDGYRLAVGDAKESLQAYKQALVALISSLRAEAAEQNAADEQETTGEDTTSESSEGVNSENE